MSIICSALQAVKNRIETAANRHGRGFSEIGLVAVSKTFPADLVRAAADCGQRRFGENYLQEALGKIASLSDLDLEWHFIGALQGNKTRLVAENFAWVHTLASERHAQRLSEQRPDHLPPLNVLIQVNISQEPSKAGVSAEQLPALAAAIHALPRLRLRGLMAIPAPTAEVESQRAAFAAVRQLRDQLNLIGGYQLDTLSMGMSADLESAIAEGTTMVRVGSAIFGERTPQKQ